MTSQRDQIDAWLAAEADEDDARAETAFAGAIRELPPLPVDSALIDRVVAAVAVRRQRRRWLPLGAAAAVAIAGVAVNFETVDVIAAAAAAVGVHAAANAVLWLTAWLRGALECWLALGRIARPVGDALAAPPVAAVVLAAEFVAAALLLAMKRLLQSGDDRIWRT